MTRIIALGPGGKPQSPARADNYRGVIDAVIGMDGLSSDDRPQFWLSPPCRNHDHADDVRRGLYRSARYYCSCGGRNCTRKHNNVDGCPDGGRRISCRADVVTVTGGDGRRRYHVQCQFFDKTEAIRRVVTKYGPDPNKWPYYSKRKKASA